MPRFAANLSMMFTEWDFLDRFKAAAEAGFEAVEFLFPYEHHPEQIGLALTGGERVMHVQWVRDPAYSARQIRLTAEEYRRLWASVRSEFRLSPDGKPIRIDHPGYGFGDAFYSGIGKANAISTCNQWSADRLRVAGVEAPLWSPFVQGLVWRYREPGSSLSRSDGEGNQP